VPYLSRIWLNPLRTRAQLFLRNPHALHAAVLGGLSRQPVTERVLWRLDTTAHRAELLVLTESAPSWEHLIEQAGWPSADEPQQLVRDYRPLLDKVQRGREFRMRLRANPVSMTRKPTKPSSAQEKQLAKERPRGVRVPHRTAAHQLRWFTDHLSSWGFEALESEPDVPCVQLIARDRRIFSKNGDTGNHRIVLSTATFDAAVCVTDPDVARERLLGGVGPAKGYGCGLITLAPIRAREDLTTR
jgi:CRISPR system Cascade subunit CasE